MRIKVQSNAANLSDGLKDLSRRFPHEIGKAMKSAAMRLRKNIQELGPTGQSPLNWEPLNKLTRINRKLNGRTDKAYGMPAMWRGIYSAKKDETSFVVGFGKRASKGAEILLNKRTGSDEFIDKKMRRVAAIGKVKYTGYNRPQRLLFEPIAADRAINMKFLEDTRKRVESMINAAARKAAKVAKAA